MEAVHYLWGRAGCECHVSLHSLPGRKWGGQSMLRRELNRTNLLETTGYYPQIAVVGVVDHIKTWVSAPDWGSVFCCT